MSRLDELKEEIGFEQRIFFMLLAAGLALVGWLFTRGLQSEPLILYIAIAATFGDAVLMVFFLRRVYNKIRSLREL